MVPQREAASRNWRAKLDNIQIPEFVSFEPQIRPLFPFNTIFDTDFGLIKLIQQDYRNEDVFDLQILDLPDDDIKDLLVKRTRVNPLQIIMKEYNENTAREYYNQFMEREYTTILEKSAFTGIGKLFVSVPIMKDIIPTVWAIQQIELDFLKAALKNPMEYHEVLGDLVYCNEYDPIVVKDASEIIMNYRNIEGHTIYLPRYGFNTHIEDGEELIEPSKAYVLSSAYCTAQVIDVYIHDGKNKEKGNKSDE